MEEDPITELARLLEIDLLMMMIMMTMMMMMMTMHDDHHDSVHPFLTLLIIFIC